MIRRFICGLIGCRFYDWREADKIDVFVCKCCKRVLVKGEPSMLIEATEHGDVPVYTVRAPS